MAERQYWDVIQFHESRNGKKFAQRLGNATPTDEGGFFINLNALPITKAEGCKILIAPSRPLERRQAPDKATTHDTELEDEVPF